jgi:hypothetical protein
MKKIIRLTESDLHNIVRNSVLHVLREQDDTMLLQIIAQALAEQKQEAVPGNNEARVELEGDDFAYIDYNVLCDPYMRQGMKSQSYDVPDDEDEIIDDVEIEVNEIGYCRDGECRLIEDNGIIKKALENAVEIDYDGQDIPSEEDYFSEY